MSTSNSGLNITLLPDINQSLVTERTSIPVSKTQTDPKTYRMALGRIVTWLTTQSFLKGTGTANYLSKFTSSSEIGNSIVYDNGTNVGIGTSSPDTKLTVSGAVKASSFNTVSSRVYKTNVTPMTNALDTTLKLQGVTFDWNKETSDKALTNDIGFIAEDVEAVLPTIVSKGPVGETTGVDYGRVTALLVEAVRELNNKVKDLEEQLAKR